MPLYFLQVNKGTIYAFFEGGMFRDDYHWDEINTLITFWGIKMYPVENAPSPARRMP